ncbi:MAG: hypothetical protein WC346_17070 [Methanogenium sp.]|jgi:hypothetical protein
MSTDVTAGAITASISDLPKKDEKVNDESNVDVRIDRLEHSVERLSDLLEIVATNLVENKKGSVKSASVAVPKGDFDDDLDELPKTWRKIVDDELGSEFIAKRRETTSGWQVLVYFPKKYDCRNGVGDSLTKYDIHSASPVRLTSSMDDLRFWCKKFAEFIRKHKDPAFNPLMQSNKINSLDE